MRGDVNVYVTKSSQSHVHVPCLFTLKLCMREVKQRSLSLHNTLGNINLVDYLA